MDISQFGLFELTGSSPRWDGNGPGALDLRTLPARIAAATIANDNRAIGCPSNAATRLASRPSRSLLGFMARRSRQPGPA